MSGFWFGSIGSTEDCGSDKMRLFLAGEGRRVYCRFTVPEERQTLDLYSNVSRTSTYWETVASFNLGGVLVFDQLFRLPLPISLGGGTPITGRLPRVHP